MQDDRRAIRSTYQGILVVKKSIRAYLYLILNCFFLIYANIADADGGKGLMRHIDILDFGRNLKYIQNSALRRQMYDWFSSHVDVAEGGVINNSDVTGEYKSRNPNMKVFRYKIDLTGDLSQSDLPEDYYLHFSEDTRMEFYKFGAKIGTASVAGCPAPQPPSASCRARSYIWTVSFPIR